MRCIAMMGSCILLATAIRADDWPQWMGPERDGIYREKGIVKEFPKAGLKVRWKKPIGQGYSGPAVANGKVYVMDRKPGPPKMVQAKSQTENKGEKKDAPKKMELPRAVVVERTVCFRADTGEQVWKRAVDTEYQLSYPEGPRATPLVAGGKVYALGAMGRLDCLNADNGELIWSRDFHKDFGAPKQAWGWAAHPFIDGDRLITLVGGKGSAVVAFNKDTGKEIWRAMDSEEVGYAPPLLTTIAGKRQIIAYMSDSVSGLDPESGKKLWSNPYPVEGKPSRPATPIGMPINIDGKIFVTSFYEGSLLLDLGSTGDQPKPIWHGTSIMKKEETSGLHGLMTTPVLHDSYVYGMCANGELRCLDPKTGERKWESLAFFGDKKALFGTAFLTQHEDRFFIFADTGDLFLAKLSPKGYEQISKYHLINAVQAARGRRKVVWSHPAYADRAVFARNQEEIICVSLADG